jgi:hypothetical protein
MIATTRPALAMNITTAIHKAGLRAKLPIRSHIICCLLNGQALKREVGIFSSGSADIGNIKSIPKRNRNGTIARMLPAAIGIMKRKKLLKASDKIVSTSRHTMRRSARRTTNIPAKKDPF